MLTFFYLKRNCNLSSSLQVKCCQSSGGWIFWKLHILYALGSLQKAKFLFLPQNDFCLVLKRKKHECVTENISIRRCRSAFFRYQNMSIATGIPVSKSYWIYPVGFEKGGIMVFKCSFLYFRNCHPKSHKEQRKSSNILQEPLFLLLCWTTNENIKTS